MTPTVLLLLSIFTVRGRGCQEVDKGTVRNLQSTISHENHTGFPEVFPKDYVVPHHVGPSTQCHNQSQTCCVFKEAASLSHSWGRLLQNLERVHLKHSFISELILQLNGISKDAWKFQEPPEPSSFPSVNSSPGALLTLTSSLLSKWLELDCPTGENACVFTTEDEEGEELEEEEEREEEKKVEESHDGATGGNGEEGNFEDEKIYLPYMEEGERRTGWITVLPTNGHAGSPASAGLLLCALSFLRIIVDVIERAL